MPVKRQSSKKKEMPIQADPNHYTALWLHTEPNKADKIYAENTYINRSLMITLDEQEKDKEIIFHNTRPAEKTTAFHDQITRAFYSTTTESIEKPHCIIISADLSVGGTVFGILQNTIDKVSTVKALSQLPICFISTSPSANNSHSDEALLQHAVNQTNNKKQPVIYLGSFPDNQHDQIRLNEIIIDLIIQQQANPHYYKIHTTQGCEAAFRTKHQRRLGLFSRTNIFEDSELRHMLYNACREDKVSVSQTDCLALKWIESTGMGNKVTIHPHAPLPVKLAYNERVAHKKQKERIDKKCLP